MNAEQLKKSLLQMAMQGRLVEQREEEPAVEQLGESPDDVPFAIPEKWKWVKFSNIAKLLNGRAYKKSELLHQKEENTPVIRVGNFFTNSKWYYSNLSLDTDKYCEKGDLLYAWSASFGPKIWDGEKSIYHYHIWKIILTEHVYRDWLYYWLLIRTQELKGSGRGLTMIHITKNGMEQELLALPPLAEQRRIVEKLEQLLPLVETYGEAQSELKAMEAALPAQLKKSLLQEAIQGRLVEQREEEPAVEQLGEAPDNVPFAIPDKWKWVNFGRIITLISGRDLTKNQIKDVPSKIPYITGASQIQDDRIIVNRWTDIPCVISNIEDILLTCKGTVGKVVINTIGEIHIARQIMAVRINKKLLDKKYVKYYLISLSPNLSKITKSFIPGISRSDILNQPFPLPPLAEQRRIVQKLEQLLPLCDKLVGN